MRNVGKKRLFFFSIFGIILFFSLFIISLPRAKVTERSQLQLDGNGTVSEPFLVNDIEDLSWIAESVNLGNEFANCYFRQTANIDMSQATNWNPIGNDNYAFSGIYDGNGYYLENLNIDAENAALFYMLNGVICNLGIESGCIRGIRCASFAVFQNSNNAAIIDCYSKATLAGESIGGIANCFFDGKIVCCWSDCRIISENQYGILFEGTDVKIYSCRSTAEKLFPSILSGSECGTKKRNELYEKKEVKKFNQHIALAQCLFADKYKVKLKLLDQSRKFVLSRKLINVFECINEWTFPFITILLVIILIRKVLNQEKEHWSTIVYVVGIVGLFSDIFGGYCGIRNLNISEIIFLSGINYAFLISLYTLLKNNKWNIFVILRRNWLMLIVIFLVAFIEFLQFQNMPHFDGTLYYASLVRSIDEYRLNLFTYLGAFVCWKEIHGLALFIAPLECLFHGEMIGVYIGNLIISVITIYFLFGLLKVLYCNLDDITIAILSVCFFFFPYAIGLFTYLCMDYQLPLFAIWLMYGLIKRNHILVSFSGFLLSFTKITGFVFFATVVCVYFIFDIVDKGKEYSNISYLKANKSRLFFYLMPIFEFLVMYRYSGCLAIQNFFGSYQSDSLITLKNFGEITCTINQSFIYGLRWIIVLMMIIAAINVIFDKKEMSGLCLGGKKIILSVCVGCLMVVGLLIIYNGDAMCPRYTAILNAGYIVVLPFVIFNFITFHKVRSQLVAGIICLLMIIQTYINIDPTLFLNTPIDLGKTKIYAGVPSYIKTIEWDGKSVLNDCYVYNYQHNVYGNLMNELFAQVQPTEEQKIYVLDTHEYELNIAGSWNRNYKIYWNSRKKKFNFDEWDKDAHYLNVSRISSEEICNNVDMENEFFLIVPSRAGKGKLDSIRKQFNIVQEYRAENIYTDIEMLLFKHK